jgi:hypothetical protein
MRAHDIMQTRNGGDALVGRELLPFVLEAGLTGVKLEAR